MEKKQDIGASDKSDRATRASTEPASSLGHSAGIPSAEWRDGETYSAERPYRGMPPDAHFSHAEQEAWRCVFCGGLLGRIRWTTHFSGPVVHTTTIMCDDCGSHHFVRDGKHSWEPSHRAAQAIEARSGETEGLAAQHESAVAESHAPETHPQSTETSNVE